MHAIQLLEIGKCFASCCSTLTTLRSPPSEQACQDYWLANRFRHESWIKHIRQHQDRISKVSVQQRIQQWQDIVPLLQEILLTEPLSRTVAFYSKLSEQRGVESELSFAADSAFTAHQEARMRCLNLMVFGFGIPAELVRQLNHIRLACETYNDQVLSLMPDGTELGAASNQRWRFQPAKIDRLDRGQHSIQKRTVAGEAYLRLRSQWISNWFLQTCALELDYRSWSSQHNRDIARGLLGMIDSENFDSFGVLQGASFARLQQPSSEQSPVQPKELEEPLLTWQVDTVSDNAADLQHIGQNTKFPTSPLDILPDGNESSQSSVSEPHLPSIGGRIGRR